MVPCPSVDVVGVGLNATDTLIQLHEFPARGAKVEYDSEEIQPGGQVASAMVACQMWGLQTRYVGKLGDDDAARLHERSFQQAGVEAHMMRVPDALSPRSLILVDSRGERTIFGRRDERVVLQPEDLRQEWVVNARALLVDGHDTAAAALAAGWARGAGLPVVADLDEVYPGVDALLCCVDHLIVSRDLPERLTGERNLGQALRAMHSRYGSTLTAATLGPDGVLAWDGECFIAAAAFQVPVVDTTGAGDMFHAAYLYGLLQRWPLSRKLDFACAAAAINCTAQGARGHIAPVAEIERLMAQGARYPPPSLGLD